MYTLQDIARKAGKPYNTVYTNLDRGNIAEPKLRMGVIRLWTEEEAIEAIEILRRLKRGRPARKA